MNANFEENMVKEDNIRDFFQKNKPTISDGGTFMVGLSSRMDALSEIREIQKQSQHRSRKILAVTFCTGIIAGIIISIIVVRMSGTLPELISDNIKFLKNSLDNTYVKPLAMLLIASGAITFGARYVKSLFSE